MRMLWAVAMLLAGCTMTPQNVRDSKISESIVRPGKLATVAICVSHGFDELRTQNNLRLDEAAGIGEMIATDQGVLFVTGTGAVFVVDFRQIESGTEVVYYIRWDVIAREHTRKRIREIINSC